MILKPYPQAERPSLRLKICAAGALIGKRAEWGYRRKWEGNYLFLVRTIDNHSINNNNNNTTIRRRNMSEWVPYNVKRQHVANAKLPTVTIIL